MIIKVFALIGVAALIALGLLVYTIITEEPYSNDYDSGD